MARTLIPRLTDIVEAIERIRGVLHDISLEAFETDWQKQWLVERGVLIVSEASRHLTDELKARYPEIPWTKVAGIGNVLRHNYENVAAPIMWKLAQVDLPILQEVCQTELTRAVLRGRQSIRKINQHTCGYAFAAPNSPHLQRSDLRPRAAEPIPQLCLK